MTKKAHPEFGRRVFVGMSGGVDSSVAALLLKRRGYDVIGVFMRCYNLDGCAERDAEDARRVAEKIKIPFYVWDFEEEYKKRVVEYMIDGYRKGITPNPDVMCNREIKFGLFLERALEMGADYVATGHYVVKRETYNVKHGGKKVSRFTLHVSRDANKDQSYFLWTLTQKQLTHCLFPIGDYLKPRVREIARRAGLPTAEKKDSQGICFLGMVSMDEFLEKYIPRRRGDVLDVKGRKIGEHVGAHFYTIGQRRGIGNIKHQKGNRTHVPVYVVRKNIRKNTVTVAEGAEDPELYRKVSNLIDVNLISPAYLLADRHKEKKGGGAPEQHTNILKNVGIKYNNIDVLARVRYRQPLTAALLKIGKNNKATLLFRKPQRFIAEGQSAVFYNQSGEVLGGGIIA
ncbi:MAG: tRNA 2-thiouridine(34) synthase MnmA [Candidatus Liptonbacteria bacterium]